MTVDKFYELEAMKYYDKSDDSKLSPTLLKRKYDMINNVDNLYVASQKWDGNWMMFIKDENDVITIRGRARNVKNVYENYVPKIIHLASHFKALVPPSTVILAEVCWPELGKVATDVGTILRCLPAKAIERQKDHKLVARIFDVLMYAGEDLTNVGYLDRVMPQGEMRLSTGDDPYFAWTEFYFDNFANAADDIISRGGEGVVIQRKDYIYEPGKRTAWKTLKLKQQLPEVELKVIGTLEPTRVYSGIEECIWGYWEGTYEDGTKVKIDHTPGNIDREYGLEWVPVTKPYYYGWKMGVIVDYDGNPVKVASGTSDMEKEWLASEEAAEFIKTGKLFAIVKGMQETSNADGTKSIRHPVLVRLRTDL